MYDTLIYPSSTLLGVHPPEGGSCYVFLDWCDKEALLNYKKDACARWSPSIGGLVCFNKYCEWRRKSLNTHPLAGSRINSIFAGENWLGWCPFFVRISNGWQIYTLLAYDAGVSYTPENKREICGVGLFDLLATFVKYCGFPASNYGTSYYKRVQVYNRPS